MEPRYVSTAEASRALGISVSTVKRWVDEGVLPAHKTVGGHRKLLVSDIVRLGRAGRLPNLDLSRLELLGTYRPGRDLNAIRNDTIRALLAGETSVVHSIFLGAYQEGIPLEQLFDEVVVPSLDSLTDANKQDASSLRGRHAVQLCKAELYELKSILELRACRNCPVAVGGSPEGDFDPLGSLMLQLVLLDAGWETVNLGPNTPMSTLGDAIAELRPKLVWVTFNRTPDDDDFLDAYNDMAARASEASVALVLNGKGLAQSLRANLPYTAFGDRLAHVAAFARTLHPSPRIPRRGRPASSGSGTARAEGSSAPTEG